MILGKLQHVRRFAHEGGSAVLPCLDLCTEKNKVCVLMAVLLPHFVMQLLWQRGVCIV